MIRNANLLDVPWLLEQIKEFDRFFGAKKSLLPSDHERAVSTLESFITTQPFFIASDVNGRMGFIVGALMRHYFNPEIICLYEMLWWVDPKFRGTSAGARLLNHFIEYGKENADWITMTLESKSPVSAQSLERKGFRHHETGFLLEVA